MRNALPAAFRPRAGRPAIVGHRGVRGTRPENTLAAIREAKRQGADAVEIDVRPCASGEVVVFHDVDLARIGGRPEAIADMSFAELRRVDAGEGEQIPLLEEVLETALAAGMGVNVEIKHDTPDRVVTARAVARVLGRWDKRIDLVVSSFEPAVLALHRALVSRVPHALLVHESTYHDWALRVARAADGVHLEKSLAVPARVRPFVEKSFVNVWTINDPVEARRVFAMGVGAVITDEPERIASAFLTPTS